VRFVVRSDSEDNSGQADIKVGKEGLNIPCTR